MQPGSRYVNAHFLKAWLKPKERYRKAQLQLYYTQSLICPSERSCKTFKTEGHLPNGVFSRASLNSIVVHFPASIVISLPKTE